MTEIERRLHLVHGKIIGHIAQPKGLSAEIYGVGTVMHCYFQFFHVAGRSQQFGFLHGNSIVNIRWCLFSGLDATIIALPIKLKRHLSLDKDG